jgi:hypothetical protein
LGTRGPDRARKHKRGPPFGGPRRTFTSRRSTAMRPNGAC